jgi:phospholipid/cholesterol/gamma-HCH transport system substrate-binding protein
MRKGLIALAVVAAIAAVVLLLTRDGSEDGYQVRAVFDNGSFLVPGEEVRVAGATVGTIEKVDVTQPGEDASYEDGRWSEAPGKAVLVLKIDDPGFQDFRRDATCMIRPQSLIGEKFVDCRPTLPRAPGTPPAPPLKEIPDGEPGAGQHLLPIEQNSTSVDPDLVNNISRLPYAQRFRLILNEIGASLAGRGEDIEEAVKRANPALRDADRLFGILAAQRDELAQLASDSEQILEPFARERAAVAGFLSNSGAAAQATTERGAELEESLQRLPEFIREFESTLTSLESFTDAATPVFEDLDRAAPSLTRATLALTPFSAAATVSLKSLGASGEVAGPKIREADPIVRKARDLARTGAPSVSELARFLVSTKKSKGFESLVDLIYNGAASTNEFDEYGHFLRTLVTLVDCTEYRLGPKSNCVANFTGFGAVESAAFDEAAVMRRIEEELAEQSGGTAAGSSSVGPPPPTVAPSSPASPGLGDSEGIGPEVSSLPSNQALLELLPER